MQKALPVLGFLLASFCARAQTKTPSADEVLKPVYTQAAQGHKNVLLIFHASWCGWCHKMDSSLQAAGVRPLIDKSYVTTHLTAYEYKDKKDKENSGALAFLTNQGGADKGIPYWFVLDKQGKVLATSAYEPGKNSGCPASEPEVAYFLSVLRKTPSLNENELKVIEKRFRQNEARTPEAQVAN